MWFWTYKDDVCSFDDENVWQRVRSKTNKENPHTHARTHARARSRTHARTHTRATHTHAHTRALAHRRTHAHTHNHRGRERKREILHGPIPQGKLWRSSRWPTTPWWLYNHAFSSTFQTPSTAWTSSWSGRWCSWRGRSGITSTSTSAPLTSPGPAATPSDDRPVVTRRPHTHPRSDVLPSTPLTLPPTPRHVRRTADDLDNPLDWRPWMMSGCASDENGCGRCLLDWRLWILRQLEQSGPQECVKRVLWRRWNIFLGCLWR